MPQSLFCFGSTLTFLFSSATAEPEPCPGQLEGVPKIQTAAPTLRWLASTGIARAFLDADRRLPRIEPRTLDRSAEVKTYHGDEDAAELDDKQRQGPIDVRVTEDLHHTTKYGTPPACVRVLDLLSLGWSAAD
ncbi:MAG: hypothetical protein GY778_13410 [bacterium]|nr:hypothetical protein [bacterium]